MYICLFMCMCASRIFNSSAWEFTIKLNVYSSLAEFFGVNPASLTLLSPHTLVLQSFDILYLSITVLIPYVLALRRIFLSDFLTLDFCTIVFSITLCYMKSVESDRCFFFCQVTSLKISESAQATDWQSVFIVFVLVV